MMATYDTFCGTPCFRCGAARGCEHRSVAPPVQVNLADEPGTPRHNKPKATAGIFSGGKRWA